MAPADSELAKQHPDWLTKRLDGTTIKNEGRDERVWLNPFHPEVQQFILDLIAEIVSKYDVDGIQFDDHFSLPAEFGYDELTVGMYKKEINVSPSNDFQETFWVRWRADQINNFMQRVFSTIKAIKPDCIVSYLLILCISLYRLNYRIGLLGKGGVGLRKLSYRCIAMS